LFFADVFAIADKLSFFTQKKYMRCATARQSLPAARETHSRTAPQQENALACEITACDEQNSTSARGASASPTTGSNQRREQKSKSSPTKPAVQKLDTAYIKSLFLES
jgi:hypothetical protein